MSNRRCERTIALIDWNSMGHHPTYFTHFATAMAEAGAGAGAKVVPLYANPADFLKRLDQIALLPAVRERVAEPVQVSGPIPSRFRPSRWRGQYEAWRFFRGLGKELRAWERQHKCKIDSVFFACIYDRQFEHFRFAERCFGFPWSGLYLHARSFRMPGSPIPYTGGLPCPEKIFSSPLLKAVAVLDEGAVEPLAQITGGKPVLVFPDVTVEDLPAGGVESGLARKIKAFAAWRPVVSLTGHLQWTKGLDVFTAAAGHPDMQDVCFFMGGEINWRGISAQERRRLQQQWEDLPNFLGYFQRIISEETVNAVIRMSDIVVAAYQSFPNSSNILTKAAVFERPIVVSDGYLMAERVREYHLGEVVPEGDTDALVAALRRMLQPGYHEESRSRARWRAYREAHSLRRLTDVFRNLMTNL